MATVSARVASLQVRQRRLETIATRVGAVAKQFNLAFSQLPTDLIFRLGYVYRPQPAPGSSRVAPDRADRPPATHLMASRGCALRLHITLLAAAQATTPPGRRPRLRLPLDGRKGTVGWVQLLVTDSSDQLRGDSHLTYKDKKTRSARVALDKLRRAGLVRLPRIGETQGKYEELELLDEEGIPEIGLDPVSYTVPDRNKDAVFSISADLVRRGWIHVLEDSELAVLLMLSCGAGRISGEQAVAIPAKVRIGNYGVSEAAYATYAMLKEFGLLSFDGMPRHADGTVVDFGAEEPTVNRFQLIPDGFKANPVRVLRQALEARVADLGR